MAAVLDFLKCILGAALFFVDSEEIGALKKKKGNKKIVNFSLSSNSAFYWLLCGLVMASNQEDTFSFLENRNQRGAFVSSTCTSYSAPISASIYVEGTPSREVMFRLPPLPNMKPYH